MSVPITMDDVDFELAGLRAIMELVTEAIGEDCAAMQGREDNLAHIALAGRADSVYRPALNYVHCCLHNLYNQVEEVTS